MNMPSSLPPSILGPQSVELPPRAGGRTAASDRAVHTPVATLAVHLGTVAARRKLVLLTTVAFAVIGAAIAWSLPPVYRGTTTVLVEAAKAKIVSIDEVAGAAVGNREHFLTQVEYMKSRDVARRVVRELDLARHPLFTKRGVTGAASDVQENAAINELLRNVEVEPLKLSQMVSLSFESRDPELAAAVANKLASEYIQADLDARYSVTRSANMWLSERLAELRGKLERSERDLQAAREGAGLVDGKGSSAGSSVRQIDDLNQRLTQARLARGQAELSYAQVRKGGTARMSAPAVANNALVIRARESEATAERRLAEAAQRYGTAHPEYLQAQAELQAARVAVRSQVDLAVAVLEKDYESALALERSLEQTLERSRGSLQSVTRREGELEVLERDAATNRQLYQTFLARLKETNATGDFLTPVARVVDQAAVPERPAKPNRLQLTLLSALLGVCVGVSLALWLERRAAVLRSTEDVESQLQLPLLAAVPMADRELQQDLGRAQAAHPESAFAEAIRTALTGVKLATLENRHPVIVFTSAVPAEGKTTMAMNFAIEAARTRRVLLIDADFRRRSIGRKLGVTKERRGFTDVLDGASLRDCVRKIPALKLYVLLAGSPVDNPIDLLLSDHVADVIASLRPRFDMIVIDTPPVEVVSDSMLLSRAADGVVYVSRAGRTPIATQRRALQRLEAADARLLGVILNGHDFERAARYYDEPAAQGRYRYDRLEPDGAPA